jgi:hypothetical protein
MSMDMTNVQKLQAANILPTPSRLSSSDEELINNLDSSEVDTLVDVKAQLGDDFIQRNTSLIL